MCKTDILLTWFLNVLCKPCTCKWNSNDCVMIMQIIKEQSLDYNHYNCFNISALTNFMDLQKATEFFWILFSA